MKGKTMKHKETQPLEHRYLNNKRQEAVKPLLEQAITACARHGGAAEIGNGYVIVDTSKFNVVLR